MVTTVDRIEQQYCVRCKEPIPLKLDMNDIINQVNRYEYVLRRIEIIIECPNCKKDNTFTDSII